MTSLRDRCIQFFQDENIKKDLREIAKPILETIYDELNIYVWIVIVYNIFLVFIILATVQRETPSNKLTSFMDNTSRA